MRLAAGAWRWVCGGTDADVQRDLFAWVRENGGEVGPVALARFDVGVDEGGLDGAEPPRPRQVLVGARKRGGAKR